MTAPSNSSAHRNVVPSEVGWQFVPQYYTFVNKQPDRLHCFYTKKSTFIHGTEGEDGKPCHGQQEIHAKITSIGFQDCKVFIHSVDAQSSADGGIIIQVIGEMSNHNDPWRKFVQTFFLAEQPNGYFVLNDIFRFLKEETVESDEAEEPVETVAPMEPQPEPVPAPVEVPRERTPTPPPPPPPVEPVPATPPPVEEPPTTVADVPEPPARIPTPEPPKPPTPAPVAAPPAQTNGIHSPEPAAPAAAPPPVVEKAPTPKAPPAPKTWANLAAANSKKWGAAVAQESRGTTEVVPSSTPGSGTQTPSAPAPAPNGPVRTPHPAYVAAQAVTSSHCFVKGVTEPISQPALTAQLANFGTIKEIDIVRSKACAFVEFTTVEAAKRAIIASLPAAQGGGGGVWVEATGEVSTVRITVETKKERGDRPVSRPRGGAPQGETRGGGSGGGGFRGARGRGGRGAAAGGK
ncbi:hypothetical protein ARMGADRAFT_995701 [Armillaria gallica]|uniref:NTF2-domain-containing protein n=1 Tax=Armillaria gallica TaxID=47427 RepID=A0A2H3DH90_ARMGA|nr:hypothetical protein ARMGADRAFT_995701 [Armillaria gallica]